MFVITGILLMFKRTSELSNREPGTGTEMLEVAGKYNGITT